MGLAWWPTDPASPAGSGSASRTEAIEARKWHVQVDRDAPGNQDDHQQASWAQAIEPAPPEDLDDLVPLSATGPTARDVLMIVLAKVLRQEHAGPGVPLEQIAEDWTGSTVEEEP